MLTRKRNLIRIFSISLFLLLFMSKQAFTAPKVTGVSGDFSHDAAVTITGTGFGTKISGQAAPIRYDDFEEGTVGENVETSGFWSRELSVTYARYDDGVFDDPGVYAQVPTADDLAAIKALGTAIRPMQRRDQYSQKHIRWHGLGWTAPPGDGAYSQGNFYKENIGFANTGKAYVNLWVYFDFTSGVPLQSVGWQLKVMRIHPTRNHSSSPFFTTSLWIRNNVNTNWFYHTVADQYFVPGPTSFDYPTEGYWMNLVMIFKGSSGYGVADGAATITYSKTPMTKGPYYKGIKNNIVTRYSGDSGPQNTLSLGYYMANGGTEANTYWDDVYIDNSWARVEIGNDPNYNNCNHREIQIPSAWSTNSITVKVKQGSFADSDQVYLFVVDEAGTVSPGYGPINFGAGSGVPVTPADLQGTLVKP